jgi:hypothetical protein
MSARVLSAWRAKVYFEVDQSPENHLFVRAKLNFHVHQSPENRMFGGAKVDFGGG